MRRLRFSGGSMNTPTRRTTCVDLAFPSSAADMLISAAFASSSCSPRCAWVPCAGAWSCCSKMRFHRPKSCASPSRRDRRAVPVRARIPAWLPPGLAARQRTSTNLDDSSLPRNSGLFFPRARDLFLGKHSLTPACLLSSLLRTIRITRLPIRHSELRSMIAQRMYAHARNHPLFSRN